MATYDPQLDLREEQVNAITHGLGIIFGLICIPVMLVSAFSHVDATALAGISVYGISFLMVFTFSTLFHWSRAGKRRARLKMLDHISIYFLIAGTYTPLILLFVNNHFGIVLLYTLWSLTFVGTIFKIFFTGKFEIVSTVIYLAMGWMLLAGARSFFANMPSTVVILIIAGGVLYTIGVIFYIKEWFRYQHAVWHLLVLSAAICHFTAILSSI